MKKYKLVKSDIPGLFRVKANRNIESPHGTVVRGNLGGYVASENNLSQSGECWIFDNAKVYNEAQVKDDAAVREGAVIRDFACISGRALVRESAKVQEDAEVKDEALVTSNAIISESAVVRDEARIYGNSKLMHNVIAENDVMVYSGEFGDDILLRYGVAYNNDVETLLRCSVGVPVFDKEVIAYKYVIKKEEEKFFRSFFKYDFIYRLNRFAYAVNPEISKTSCATGLHCGNMTYWEHEANSCGKKTALLQVKVNIKDIITIQEGKIRCTKLKVVGVVKNSLKKS